MPQTSVQLDERRVAAVADVASDEPDRLARQELDLTDEEFNAVSSEIEPIVPRYDIYIEKGDWLNQKWTELIVG